MAARRTIIPPPDDGLFALPPRRTASEPMLATACSALAIRFLSPGPSVSVSSTATSAASRAAASSPAACLFSTPAISATHPSALALSTVSDHNATWKGGYPDGGRLSGRALRSTDDLLWRQAR